MTQLFMVLPGPLPAGDLPECPGLRRARTDDAEQLAVLLSAAYPDGWDADRVNKVLLEAADVPVTWVIDDGAGIVATASERLLPALYPGAGYVHFVAAAGSVAGRGLGSIVTQRVLAGFAERGLQKSVLETDDFRVPAIVTYLRLGFVPEYRCDAERVAWSAVLSKIAQSRRHYQGRLP